MHTNFIGNSNLSTNKNTSKTISEFKEFELEGFKCFSARYTHIRLPEEYYVGYIAFPKDYATAVKAAQIDSNGLPDDVEITWFNEYGIPPILDAHADKYKDFLFLGADLNHIFEKKLGMCLNEIRLHYELKAIIHLVTKQLTNS